MTEKLDAPLPPPQARTPNRAEINKWLDTRDDPFKILAEMRRIGNLAMVLEEWQKHLGIGAESAPTSHQELVEKARKFVHAMDRKPHSSGPTRAATWMLEYATGDTRMDIYELLVAFVESIDGAGAERGVPLGEK